MLKSSRKVDKKSRMIDTEYLVCFGIECTGCPTKHDSW